MLGDTYTNSRYDQDVYEEIENRMLASSDYREISSYPIGIGNRSEKAKFSSISNLLRAKAKDIGTYIAADNGMFVWLVDELELYDYDISYEEMADMLINYLTYMSIGTAILSKANTIKFDSGVKLIETESNLRASGGPTFVFEVPDQEFSDRGLLITIRCVDGADETASLSSKLILKKGPQPPGDLREYYFDLNLNEFDKHMIDDIYNNVIKLYKK